MLFTRPYTVFACTTPQSLSSCVPDIISSMPIKPQHARYFARQKFLLNILPIVPGFILFAVILTNSTINIIYDITMPSRYTIILYLVATILMAAGAFAFTRHRKRVHRAYEARDYRVCVGCGYDIADQPDGSPCPECGLPINFPEFKHQWRNMFDPYYTISSKK